MDWSDGNCFPLMHESNGLAQDLDYRFGERHSFSARRRHDNLLARFQKMMQIV